MILLNFGLFWCGAKLSYLRYLTFKTLRHFHPRSRIQLFISSRFRSEVVDGNPPQEYSHKNLVSKDYIRNLRDLNVEVVPYNVSSNPDKYFPYQQADIFRWMFLRNYGGVYLDPDQIILRSFNSIPIKNCKFMYSDYKIDSPYAVGKRFCPIGVLGASTDSKVVAYMNKNILSYYNSNNYDAMGVSMMRDVLGKVDLSESFNAPANYFYPAPICDRMQGVYDGTLEINDTNYALHWFGGYAPSQEFNLKYTEEFAKTSNDSISRFLRKEKII